MLVAALAALVAFGSCPALEGADTFFSKTSGRVVWAGEVHGTTEQPELFGDLVCIAGRTGRPVVVVLERSQDEQPAWDRFLVSKGEASDIAALIQGSGWQSEVQDGRSSQAELALAERLRMYKSQGIIRDVRMLLPVQTSRTTSAEYESQMARVVAELAASAPGSLILVYSGNYHARKSKLSLGGETYAPAADDLPSANVTSVNVVSGAGYAWNCRGRDCGPHPYVPPSVHERAIVFGSGVEGFDAVAYAGKPTTASPPAFQRSKAGDELYPEKR